MANPSIEKKLVEMDFDNSRFEKNVNQSIGTIDRLKQSLNMDGAAKSFNTLEKQANSIDFSGLAKSIDRINYRFSALGIAGATVINNLTNKALGAVGKLNNAVFGQMKSGGISRALNLEHANFMMQGLLKDADKVAEIMKEGGPVQNAVKGTAYGLDAAASAAAQFIASGVTDLNKLENALTGISGVAAMTGASYEDIASIFTTVAGQGKVMTMQFRQIEARGLNAAAALSEYLGKSEAEVRDMVSKGKIDFETFAEAMNKTFGDQAKKANDTFTGALSNVKAALSRIGAKVATPTLEKMREMFVKLIDVVNMASKVLDPFIGVINNVIGLVLGGVTDTVSQLDKLQAIFENVVQTVGAVLQTLYSVILPVKRAFESVFPKKTIDDAIATTKAVRNFVRTLSLSAEQMVTVTRIFRGIFSVFDIVGQVISALVRVLFPATKGVKSFIESFANGAANIGDYIYAISKALKETDAIYKFFTLLAKKLEPVKQTIVSIFSFITKHIKNFVKSLDFKDLAIGDIFKKLTGSLKEGETPIKKMGNLFSFIFGGIGETIKSVSPLLGAFANVCGNALKEIGGAIETVLTGGGFKTLLSLVNSAFLVTIGLDIAAFIHQIVGSMSKSLKLIDGIKGLFANISTHIKVMTQSVKADILVKIAKAIAILAASLFILSTIPADKLANALVALTIVAAELMGLMFVFTKIADGLKESAALFTGGIGFAAIAAGVLILAGAMKTIAGIPADAIDRSLGVVTAFLVEMTAVALILGNFGEKVKTGAVGIIALAASVKILGSAMAQIGSLNPETLVKGLIGISVALLELAGAALLIGESDFGVRAGAGILLMAAAIKVIASAMQQIGSMDPAALGNSLLAMGAALAEIGVFMAVMGDEKHLLGTAAAIGILSLALLNIASAMEKIGGLSPEQLVTSLIGIGAVLIEIGGALLILSDNALGAVGAAAAIMIICVALNALMPILTFFSTMDLAKIGTTLLGFAGAFTVLGVAAAIFGSAVGLMLLGAAAIAALGAACLVSAAGMAASAIAIGLLVSAFETLTTLNWLDLLNGIAKLAVTFAALSAASALLAPTVTVMVGLSASLIAIGAAALMVAASISVAAIGLSLMAESLKKFETISWETIGKGLVTLAGAVAALVVAGLALAPVAPVILAIGIGIAGIGVGALATAAALILFAKAAELLGPIMANIQTAVTNFVVNAWAAIQNFFDNFWEKLLNFGTNFSKFMLDLGAFLLNGFISATQGILKFLVKLGGEMLKALGVPEDWVNVAVDFMNGLITGIGDMIKNVVNKVKDVGKSMIDGIRDAIDSHSDSKETIEVGHDWDGGLITGVLDLKDQVVGAVAEVGQGMIIQANEDANKVKDIWNSLSQAQIESAASEDKKRSDMFGYASVEALSKAGQAGLLDHKWAHKATTSTNAETDALNKNTGGTKSNTKAKKENEKANEKKTKAIDEESEALEEETESVEDNEEAIREQAEQIEIVTKEFDKYLNAVKLMQGHYGLSGLTKSLSKFWSKGFGEKGLSTVKNIDKAFKSATKNLNTLPKSMKTVSYAFSDSGKYLEKLSKSISKTNTTMSNYANKTGKTVVKLYDDYGKVFEKNGKKIDTFNVRLSKNIKNMGKQIAGYKKFVAEMNRMDVNDAIYHAEDAEWFINNLRKIEKYVTTKGSASKNIQQFLNETFRKLTEGAEELEGALNTLGKNIDGVGNALSKKSQSTAYVEDAFISLAATLYDGSEAANEYATEHARLTFLMENELATVEEVAEHYESYIHRISQALYEYQQQLGQTLQDSMKIFDEFNKNLLDDSTDLLSNIESQIAGMKQWSDMLMELSKRGVDANILKMLTDEGTSSYGKLKKMLEMTSGELALFNQRYKESQQVVKDARDTALAALANATTRASERAASASKSASLAQMKTSKKLAKQLIDDAKSVAENQAKYRSFTKKEEKKYLESLTVEERKAYKKRLKEAQKAEKAERKLADKEAKKRKTESTIDKSIKSFKTLSKTYRKYIKDAEGVKYINEQIAKSLEGISGNIISVNGLTKKDMQWNFMALAETLKSTGQEGLSYFEEMQQRLEDFTKSLKDALNISDKLFNEFQKADSISFDKTFKNAADSIGNMVLFRTLTAQLNAAGASTDMWNYIYENFVNGGNIAGAVEFMKMYVEASVEQRKALESMLLQANEQQGAAEAEFASYMAESTGASYTEAVATAEAELGKAREEYKKVTKDTEKELKDYQKQRAVAEARIASLNAEINSAKSIQNKKQRTEKINQLNNEIANVTKTITDLDKKIAELNSKRETAAKAVEESEQKATTAENNAVNGGKNAAKGMMDYYNSVAAQRDANQKALEDATAATDQASKDYATAQKAYNDALSAFNAEENKKGKGKASKKTKEALDAAKKNFDAAKKNLDAAKANKKAAKETRDAYVTETGDRAKIAEQQAYWTAEYNKYVTDEKAAAARWQQIQATIAAIKTSKAYSDALKNLINDNVLLRRVQEKAQESLKGISGAINQWGAGWKGITGLAETISPELNEITTAFLRLAETLDDVNSESDDWFENMGERLASYRDSINSTIKGQVSLFEEFKKFSGDSSTSASTYLNNMESQLSGLSEWLTNLQTLANRGVTGGILQMFASEGTASFEKVAAFINATDEQIGDLNQQYQQYTKLMEEAADKALAAVGQAYTDTALSLQDEMINKFIASGGQRVKEAAEDAGIMVITGVRDGVTNAMPEILSTVEATAQQVTQKIGDNISAAKVTQAVTQGLSSVDTAIATTLALTLNDFYDLITAQAINKFKMAVDSINQYTNSVLQDEFTITLHVDTSEFDDAIARMNMAIYDINATAGTTAASYESSRANQQAVNETSTDNSSSVTNVNYTQNNYSPKALSRTEIYRQTRNQLSTIEGVVSSANGG